jgi:hypothetical protein
MPRPRAIYCLGSLPDPSTKQKARSLFAPSKEAAEAVHREAHGGVANEIIEVKEGK